VIGSSVDSTETSPGTSPQLAVTGAEGRKYARKQDRTPTHAPGDPCGRVKRIPLVIASFATSPAIAKNGTERGARFGAKVQAARRRDYNLVVNRRSIPSSDH
jgi:hypothetical protein